MDDAPTEDDTGISGDDDPEFDGIPVLHTAVLEASSHTSQAVRVVSSEFLKFVCCWSCSHLVGYS